MTTESQPSQSDRFKEAARELGIDVYLLNHVREDDGCAEDIKTIGIYRSEEAAKAAIERLKDQPGFRDHPTGFHIDLYPLDWDHWAEGFVDL